MATMTGAADPYAELLAAMRGPRDFWDRPDGDWEPRPGGQALSWEQREELRKTNSAYRLGTKALRRGALELAQEWFDIAGRRQHPGAGFRAAVVELRRARNTLAHAGAPGPARLTLATGSGKTDGLMAVVGRLTAAARWGHGDAQHLLTVNEETHRLPAVYDTIRHLLAADVQDGGSQESTAAGHGPGAGRPADGGPVRKETGYTPQDGEFYAEACEHLEFILRLLRQDTTVSPAWSGRRVAADKVCGENERRPTEPGVLVRSGFADRTDGARPDEGKDESENGPGAGRPRAAMCEPTVPGSEYAGLLELLLGGVSRKRRPGTTVENWGGLGVSEAERSGGTSWRGLLKGLALEVPGSGRAQDPWVWLLNRPDGGQRRQQERRGVHVLDRSSQYLLLVVRRTDCKGGIHDLPVELVRKHRRGGGDPEPLGGWLWADACTQWRSQEQWRLSARRSSAAAAAVRLEAPAGAAWALLVGAGLKGGGARGTGPDRCPPGGGRIKAAAWPLGPCVVAGPGGVYLFPPATDRLGASVAGCPDLDGAAAALHLPQSWRHLSGGLAQPPVTEDLGGGDPVRVYRL
ncbi:hypothetical protein ACFW9F_14540 [Streptomyces sp. NPDC059506]|uniref:hypothetical protein n=1 Tax=Streptomyces sp. NPDC059506 TaxID=3347751 RepID=UPI00369D965B